MKLWPTAGPEAWLFHPTFADGAVSKSDLVAALPCDGSVQTFIFRGIHKDKQKYIHCGRKQCTSQQNDCSYKTHSKEKLIPWKRAFYFKRMKKRRDDLKWYIMKTLPRLLQGCGFSDVNLKQNPSPRVASRPHSGCLFCSAVSLCWTRQFKLQPQSCRLPWSLTCLGLSSMTLTWVAVLPGHIVFFQTTWV